MRRASVAAWFFSAGFATAGSMVSVYAGRAVFAAALAALAVAQLWTGTACLRIIEGS